MANPGKAPSLEALGYNYWKSRIKAYLLSQGTEIWEITQNAAYMIPEQRTTPGQVAQYERNNKAVNLLFSALGPVEYQRVCHLETACEIWTILANHHEGTAQVKAWLFQTYRREYENFTQKPGESVEEMFGRFQSVINKLRANKNVDDHFPVTYDTLTTAQLFSKLKASKVDKQLWSSP